MKLILPFLLLNLFILWMSAAPRVWTASDGRTITAELVDASSSQASLWREDIRSEVLVDLELLCANDRNFVAGWLEGQNSRGRPDVDSGTASNKFQAPDFGDRIDPDRAELLDRYFEAIRKLPLDYGKIGSVLEAIALVELGKLYPEPDYAVYTGIQYENHSGRTLGELDIVIWDLKENHALAVYECKLTGNFRRAGQKGREQLNRFINSLKAREIGGMRSEAGKRFNPQQFEEALVYGLIGPHGALDAKWALQIDLSRGEGDILQDRLR